MSATPLLVPGDPGQYTGGTLYDVRIARAATNAGQPIEITGLAGRFPDADAAAAVALEAALADRPGGSTVIIDGLALGGLPEVVARHADRLRLVALVHHPLADEYGTDAALAGRLFASERRALTLVRHVVVTSQFTAKRLVSAFGVDPAALVVVEPGVDKTAEPAQPPTGTSRLLCVANLIPRKGHVVLVDALSRLTDLDWHCDCLGDTERDPDCSGKVRAAIRRHGLRERVHLLGACPSEQLQKAYRRARVFVLPSYYEGYGMAVTEALSHGLPVVTTIGGALADTLPPDAGIAVSPGDADALTEALRRLLTKDGRYAQLAAGARRAADSLRGWDVAGRQFAAVLDNMDQQ